MEIGVGIGIDFSVGQCKTHLVSLIQDRNFTDLKPHCPANLACFPADAVVMTPSGDKSMRDLRVGDRVLAVNAYGQAIFDDIYFFGHADPSALAHYVHISARQVLNESDLAVDVAEEMGASDFSLELSPDHFVPACPYRQQPCSWWERKHVYAGGVASGDHIWISPIAGELQLVRVANASFVAKAGMYNPYTLSGSIVVNRMLASAHSSWILDEWTPEALSQYLPGVYQALFFPGRLMYHAAGPYAADVLDMNNPQTRPETYGGGPLFLAACGLVALAALAGAVVGSSKPVGVDNEKHLL